MRHALRPLTAALPLTLATAAIAVPPDVDMISFAVMNGHTGLVERAGITFAAEFTCSVFGPDGNFLREEHALPAGTPCFGVTPTHRLGFSTVEGLSPADIDQRILENGPGLWTIENVRSYARDLPPELFTAPTERTYARLDAASEQRVSDYRGAEDLPLAFDAPLATTVIFALHDKVGQAMQTLLKLSPGTLSVTISRALMNSAPWSAKELVLLVQSSPTSIIFPEQSQPLPASLIPNITTVDYRELQMTSYQMAVPAPGAAALVGMAAMLVRRRKP